MRMSKCRRQLYPEPGSWILDQRQGLPPIQPSPPLPKDRLLSAGEVRDDYVAYEGLGYCIYVYIPAEKIGDSKLRVLWRNAQRAMRQITKYLETVPAPPDNLVAPTRQVVRKRVKRKKAKIKSMRQSSELDLEELGEEVEDDV